MSFTLHQINAGGNTTVLKAVAFLILDDLHEADRGSLELLKFVARGFTDSRVVIVGTYRDAEVRRSPYEIYLRHGAGQRWIDRVEETRIALLDRAAALSDQRPPDNECLFRREGEYWTVGYGGVTCRLKDMKGLGYIAHLIAHPGHRIHVLDLFAQVGGSGAATAPGADLQAGNLEVVSDLGDASEVVDSRARAEYRQRLSELRAELEEAERNNDIGCAERTRNELDSLTDGVRSALGLGGRSRRFTAETERARGTVSKSIRTSLERIRRSHHELGDHLSTSIHTGYFCAYLPDPERQPSWRI